MTYTYDAVGNIVYVEDAALRPIFFANQAATATGDYYYDPIYRLIRPGGREHVSQRSHNQPGTMHCEQPC